jgi:hypothetical protein
MPKPKPKPKPKVTRRLAVGAVAVLCTALAAAPAAQAASRAPSGGYSFSGAAELTRDESTVTQTYSFGEIVLWKIYVEPGQSLSAQAELKIPQGFPGDATQSVHVALYDPTRESQSCGTENGTDGGAYVSINGDVTGPGATVKPFCGIGGGESDDAEDADSPLELAGYYYVSVAVQLPEDEAIGQGVPLTLKVERGKGDRPTPKSFDPGSPSPGVLVPKTADRKQDAEKGAPATPSAKRAAAAGSGQKTRTDSAASESSGAGDYAALGSVVAGGLLLGWFGVLAATRRRPAAVGGMPPAPPAQQPPPPNPYQNPPRDPRSGYGS